MQGTTLDTDILRRRYFLPSLSEIKYSNSIGNKINADLPISLLRNQNNFSYRRDWGKQLTSIVISQGLRL